jgi:membrane protein
MKDRKFVRLVKQSFSEWSKDNASRLSAALAYYSVFSIAPMLVIIVTIAGFFLGKEAGSQRITEQVSQFMGPQIGNMLQGVAQQAQRPSSGLMAGIISAIVLIFGASGVFYELRSSLNTIWEVEPKPGGGIMGFIRTRLSSFLTIFLVGFLLLISLAASTVLSAVSEPLGNLIPGGAYIIEVLNVVVLFGIAGLAFAAIFKMLPDADARWKDVWVGAAVTSALFVMGKFAIGIYLSKSTIASAYGAASSLVILLAFVYYCAQIFFIGAEFTQVYANLYGSRIKPSEHGQSTPHEEPSDPQQPSEPAKEKAGGEGRRAA